MSDTKQLDRNQTIQEAADKVFSGMSASFGSDYDLNDASDGIHRTICRFRGTEQLDLSLVYHYSNICDEAIQNLNHKPISNYVSQKQFIVTFRDQAPNDNASFDIFVSEVSIEEDLYWLDGPDAVYSVDGSKRPQPDLKAKRLNTFLSVEPSDPIVDNWLTHVENINTTDAFDISAAELQCIFFEGACFGQRHIELDIVGRRRVGDFLTHALLPQDGAGPIELPLSDV